MRRDPFCYRLSKRTALEKFLHLIKRPIADIASVPPVAGVTMEASWISGAARWRSAYRNGLDPSFRYINYGFRVALSPTWRSVEQSYFAVTRLLMRCDFDEISGFQLSCLTFIRQSTRSL